MEEVLSELGLVEDAERKGGVGRVREHVKGKAAGRGASSSTSVPFTCLSREAPSRESGAHPLEAAVLSSQGRMSCSGWALTPSFLNCEQSFSSSLAFFSLSTTA